MLINCAGDCAEPTQPFILTKPYGSSASPKLHQVGSALALASSFLAIAKLVLFAFAVEQCKLVCPFLSLPAHFGSVQSGIRCQQTGRVSELG
jgi:hypothetical protein